MKKYLYLSLLCHVCWIYILCPSYGLSQINVLYEPISEVSLLNPTHFAVSETYTYVYSPKQGMAVFRNHSSEWTFLYMRKDITYNNVKLFADVRFAYLYSNDRKIHIIDPTQKDVLYGTIKLDAPLKKAARLGKQLYILLQDGRLCWVSLEPNIDLKNATYTINEKQYDNIIDMGVALNKELWIASSKNILHKFMVSKNNIELIDQYQLPMTLNKLFFGQQNIWAVTKQRQLYEWQNKRKWKNKYTLPWLPTNIWYWNKQYFFENSAKEKWHYTQTSKLSYINGATQYLFQQDAKNLYLTTPQSISKVIKIETEHTEATDIEKKWKLTSIENKKVIVDHTMIIPIFTQPSLPIETINYEYSSPSIDNATMIDANWIWKPSLRDIGRHQVRINAWNSTYKQETIFYIEVSPINIPPTFVTSPPITIKVNDMLKTYIKATDPDGNNNTLIRYLGIDLPTDSKLDNKTGEFQWQPKNKHIGTYKIKFIATDQYGATNSQTITIEVIK